MEEHKPAEPAVYESTTSCFSIPGNIVVASSGPQSRRGAVSRVFNTTELLEAILLQLPVQALLRLESACKGFKSAIEGSIRIQRLMHRAADYAASPREDSYPIAKGITVRINRMCATEVEVKHYNFRLWLEFSLMAVALRQSHSFRRMQIVQPPLTSASVQHLCEEWQDFEGEYKNIENKNGITFGDLLDAVDEFQSKDCAHRGDGCLRWFFVCQIMDIVRKA